jgi:hypothetical protein
MSVVQETYFSHGHISTALITTTLICLVLRFEIYQPLIYIKNVGLNFWQGLLVAFEPPWTAKSISKNTLSGIQVVVSIPALNTHKGTDVLILGLPNIFLSTLHLFFTPAKLTLKE